MTQAQPLDVPIDAPIDAVDRRLIEATQGGRPLCAEPYQVVAESLGLEADEVMARLERMPENPRQPGCGAS